MHCGLHGSSNLNEKSATLSVKLLWCHAILNLFSFESLWTERKNNNNQFETFQTMAIDNIALEIYFNQEIVAVLTAKSFFNIDRLTWYGTSGVSKKVPSNT